LTKKIEKKVLGIGVAARAKSVNETKRNETIAADWFSLRPEKNDDSSTFVVSVEDDFSKVLFSYF
jgi:hypothetical protein